MGTLREQLAEATTKQREAERAKRAGEALVNATKKELETATKRGWKAKAEMARARLEAQEADLAIATHNAVSAEKDAWEVRAALSRILIPRWEARVEEMRRSLGAIGTQETECEIDVYGMESLGSWRSGTWKVTLCAMDAQGQRVMESYTREGVTFSTPKRVVDVTVYGPELDHFGRVTADDQPVWEDATVNWPACGASSVEFTRGFERVLRVARFLATKLNVYAREWYAQDMAD